MVLSCPKGRFRVARDALGTKSIASIAVLSAPHSGGVDPKTSGADGFSLCADNYCAKVLFRELMACHRMIGDALLEISPKYVRCHHFAKKSPTFANSWRQKHSAAFVLPVCGSLDYFNVVIT